VRTLFAFCFDIIQNVSDTKLCLNFYRLILVMERASGESVPSLIYLWFHIIRNTVSTLLKRTFVTDYRSTVISLLSGFGGLELACWPLVPKLAGSHSAEAIGFLGRKKSSARLPSEGK
jgi:hypothetical protein